MLFTVLYPKCQAHIGKTGLSALVEEDKKIYQGTLKNDLSKFPRHEVEPMLFVRDPMERVLSAYKDKFIKDNKYFHQWYGRGIIKRYRPNTT